MGEYLECACGFTCGCEEAYQNHIRNSGHQYSKAGHRVLYRGDAAASLTQELVKRLNVAYLDKIVFDRSVDECQRLRQDLASYAGTQELNQMIKAGFTKIQVSMEKGSQSEGAARERELRQELEALNGDKLRLEAKCTEQSAQLKQASAARVQQLGEELGSLRKDKRELEEKFAKKCKELEEMAQRVSEEESLKAELETTLQDKRKIETEAAEHAQEAKLSSELVTSLRQELDAARQEIATLRKLHDFGMGRDVSSEQELVEAESRGPLSSWDSWYSKKKDGGTFKGNGWK